MSRLPDYQKIYECRCCGGDKLHEYLDLGEQPLANSYHKGQELPVYPLRVNVCQECWHSQLSHVVRPDLMFKQYLYVSGTTNTFRDHCYRLAKEAKWFRAMDDPKVLDVACNDGTLLSYFRDIGCDVYGVDPAENLREITKAKGIDVEVGYWGTGVAERLPHKFDIITATNVFAHVHDPGAFLEECLAALNEKGVIVIEFPYCNEMISQQQFDTIYHEHLSYFLVNSFTTLARRKGLKIRQTKLTDIHGGSIRFYLTREGWECRTVDELIAKEKDLALFSAGTYNMFAYKVRIQKTALQNTIASIRQSGLPVCGYGASAKGNTMLNHFGIDLDFIVDDNPMKQGYLTPGRDVPIVSPEELKKHDELCIIITAWNFYDEIVNRIEQATGKKHHYIRYVPEVTCS